jgi:hypothetical protein
MKNGYALEFDRASSNWMVVDRYGIVEVFPNYSTALRALRAYRRLKNNRVG